MYKQLNFFLSIILFTLFCVPIGLRAENSHEIRFMVKKINLIGELPIAKKAFETVLFNAKNRRYTLKELHELSKTIESIVRDEGYAFYRVIVPPQALNSGEVDLKLISFALDGVEVSGNTYFDTLNIRRSLPALAVGKAINTYDLSNALKAANYSPAKQLKLTFKQSENTDKVTAEVGVIDQRPYHFSFMANNAGTKDTGHFRLTVAAEHQNIWNLDHHISASFTTSPDHADEIMQYGFSYNAPLYFLKSWLTGYYSKSDSNTGIVADGFDISGSGEMYGFHYLQYLPKFKALKHYEHWLDVGLDNRAFNSSILFEASDLGNNVRSTPLSFRYKGEFPWKTTQTYFYIEWVQNIAMGSNSNDTAYEASRLGAKNDWNLIRYGVSNSVMYQQWRLVTNFSGQYTNDALISGEQFGLGGTYSVRGYSERETSADSGNVLHLEIHSPYWYNTHFIGFFDYGQGTRTIITEGDVKDWQVSSMGFGVRWYWQQFVSFSLDWAFALDDVNGFQTGSTQAGDSRLHGSIMLRY